MPYFVYVGGVIGIALDTTFPFPLTSSADDIAACQRSILLYLIFRNYVLLAQVSWIYLLILILFFCRTEILNFRQVGLPILFILVITLRLWRKDWETYCPDSLILRVTESKDHQISTASLIVCIIFICAIS